MPRLVHDKVQYDRQGGGRNRGAGEKKLELNKRRIEQRIHSLERELELVKKNRENQSSKRNKNTIGKVALVGYTNAGKSSLMNALLHITQQEEHKLVFEKDMLFATLETSTRLIDGYQQLPFLLTDTVGFISYLPHVLVQAFKSTLEEIKEANALLETINELFIQHLPDNGSESLKRLENKEARNFYSMMFEWRVKNKSYAEMISLFVGYWHQLYKKDRNWSFQ